MVKFVDDDPDKDVALIRSFGRGDGCGEWYRLYDGEYPLPPVLHIQACDELDALMRTMRWQEERRASCANGC